jgi:DMSO reductase anchor subunit
MHPAYSVIFFTTASGAGYGLLIWIAMVQLFSGLPEHQGFRWAAFIFAFGLVTAGLLASTAHLGRPERAWRAFSQWQTSWLSREGVAAVFTYVPAGLLAIWALFGAGDRAQGLWSLLTIAGAVATVACTAMIYASLTTIRAWNEALVLPVYLVLALATGGVLYSGLAAMAGHTPSTVILLTILLLVAGGAMKALYWSRIDGRQLTLTTADAIGLPGAGTARPIEPAHTQSNFVMHEMGYDVARRHSDRLRLICSVLLFVVPALALLVLLGVTAAAPLFSLIAIISTAIGVFIERWLFFAEAQHVVTLYYGEAVA